jgi:CRISPR-associated protein Cmr1
MQSITFECEVITPMFLAGADGITPELRPPSIKGALRFWWRALNGHLPLHELKEREDEIFGGTDGRSKVILNVNYSDPNMNNENVPKFNYIKNYKLNKKGIQYFNVVFYHHSKEREGIAAGVKFSLTLKSKNKVDLIEVANIFWIMSVLGGLGTRCRRGNGAFGINKILRKSKDILYADLSFYYKNKKNEFVKGNITSLRKLISLEVVKAPTLFSSLNNAQIFYSSSANGKSFKTWDEALSDIAWKMMTIRDTETRKSIDNNFEKFTQEDLDKKAAFGLPFGILNGGMVNLYTKKGGKEKIEEARRASPIYITINKVGKNYYWIVTFLQGIFMPNDSKIIFNNKNGSEVNNWDNENHELINEFRNKLMAGWGESIDDLDAELEALKLGIEYKAPLKAIKIINI